MNLNELEKLNNIYQNALMACDPLDFANRQKILLWAISEHLLKPLFDIENEKNAIDYEPESDK